MSPPSEPNASQTSLRICFASGERPYLFWISDVRPDKQRYKILSKRGADGGFELLVIQESGRARHVLAHQRLARDLPSGWLAHWVDRFARELDLRLRCYDLRHVATSEEWSAIARRLGWLRGSARVESS